MTSQSSETTPDISSVVHFDTRYSFRSTIAGLKSPVLLGPSAWWTTNTPQGPVTLELKRLDTETISTNAWGEGSEWATNKVPDLLGVDDGSNSFAPEDELAKLWKNNKFRLGRTDLVWDSAIGAILSQKVQVTKAMQSLRGLRNMFGAVAPGPLRSKLLPTPPQVCEMSYTDFHRLGVERKRAETIIRLAKEIPRLKVQPITRPANYLDQDRLNMKRLASIRGIGLWTLGLIDAVAYGNSDAVPVGDYHIPNTVAWNLHGISRATDAEMLEMLEPYRPHRWRVIRLCKANSSAPKYGPRLSLRGFGISEGR